MSKIAQALAAAAGNKPAQGTSIFNHVVLQLDGDGITGDTNTVFTDSQSSLAITPYNYPAQVSFSPLGNKWSTLFNTDDASGITFEDNESFQLGTGQYTMEAWINARADQNSFGGIIAKRNSSGTWWRFTISGTSLSFSSTNGSESLSSSFSSYFGKWTHVAVTRDASNTVRMFINGTVVASTTASNDLSFSGIPLRIGALTGASSSYAFRGHISDVRIVKGTAVYTNKFPVPKSPLEEIPGTVLLTCNNKRHVDTTSNSWSPSGTGDSSITSFSPYSPTSAYGPTVDGTSIAFNGVNSYLTAGAASNWTFMHNNLSTWKLKTKLYRRSSTQQMIFCTNVNSVNNGYGMQFNIAAEGTVQGSFTAGTDGYRLDYSSATGIIPIKEWVEIELTFTHTNPQGSKFSLLVNGVSQAGFDEITKQNNNPTGNNFVFSNNNPSFTAHIGTLRGSASGFGRYYDGWMADYQIYKDGTLFFDMKGQDAAIYDLAKTSLITTISPVQISGSVKKYGSGSLQLGVSGSTTSRIEAISEELKFFTDDFTIEFWIYFNSINVSGVVTTILDGRTSSDTSALMYAQESSGGWTAYKGDGNNFSTGWTTNTFSSGQWHHIAISRTSGVTKIFVDGSQTASVSDTSSYNSGYLHIGGRYAVNGNSLDGWIDDLRVTKGIGLYTEPFTPPDELAKY
jgi:hypothetical protein